MRLDIRKEELEVLREKYPQGCRVELVKMDDPYREMPPGIGNNCQYPVYYHPEGVDEIQQCGSINLNSGLYGEGFVSCEDYNGRRIGAAYEVNTRGVKRK